MADQPKTPFFDKSTVKDAFDESRKWMRPYFDPLDELERLARNRPSTRIPEGLPKITDGTMAAIVQETPKRVIQQTPSGLFECKDYPEYAKMADIEVRDKLIPMAIKNGSYLQKTWNMLGKALTYGRSTSYTFYTQRAGVMYCDFVIPYVKDSITEKGKVFGPDSNYRFMRSWYQKTDLKAIIAQEKKMEAAIKGYKSDWDLGKLADFIEKGASAKPAELQTPAEKEKGDGYSGGYEVIHAFQVGKGAAGYSFAPRYDGGNPFRTKINKDPRGSMPLDDLYCNIDLSNPLGRGSMELSAGTQNLMDQQLQLFQFMMALLSAPPMQTWGSVNKTSMKLLPNAIWDMGTNPNNRVEPYRPMAEPITGFVSNFQFLQSKIQNLNNSTDTSVGASSGNYGQSKTQAGVNAQMERLGVSDNYLRRQTEEWFSNQIETGTNIYFSEMKGKNTITLDAQDLKEFSKTPAAKFIKGNKLTIPYKDINDVIFHFNYNPDSSQVKESSENVDRLKETLAIIQTSQDQKVRQLEYPVTKVIIKEIGAEGTDDLFPEDQTDEQGNPIQTQQQPQIDPTAILQAVTPALQQVTQQIMQQTQDMVKQGVAEAKKANNPTPEERLIKVITPLFDKLPEDARQKVLADLGLATGQGTPADNKQTLDTLAGINAAEPQNDPQAGIMNDPASPREQQFIQELMHQGYNDNDVEQGVVMLRQGMQPHQITQVLGAKHG